MTSSPSSARLGLVRRLWAAVDLEARDVQFYGGLALAWYGGAPLWAVGAALALVAVFADYLVRKG